MTSLRTHYLIDYTSGFCFGILSCIAAEKLSYYSDVKIQGRRAQSRGFLYHKACPGCGWSQENPLNLIDHNEKKHQAFALVMYKKS